MNVYKNQIKKMALLLELLTKKKLQDYSIFKNNNNNKKRLIATINHLKFNNIKN